MRSSISARLLGSRERTRSRSSAPVVSLVPALSDHRRYEAQIDRLHQRHLTDGGLHRIEQDGVSLASVVQHRSAVSRKLARAVASGGYELAPATLRRIRVDGKLRTVFDYPLLDLIVHGVVAELLDELVAPTLSSTLYSYRPGTSWADGVADAARFLRAHRRARPDPRDRGVYILRRDIDAYTDSIPTGPTSRLWAQVERVLGGPPDAPTWSLLHAVLRPVVRDRMGGITTLERGVATGQPISCVVFNLYLGDLDHELAAVPGAFTARYSDDLFVAHPDACVARELSDLLDRRSAELDLRFNPGKRQDVYLTGAGRASIDWPEARGTTGVTFLGMRIAMDGTVALGERKVRGLLRDARRRAANTVRAMEGRSVEERGRAVTGVINLLLDPDETHLQGAPAALLARAVTDRSQLEWLDHELARIVAGAVSGRPGPAAFRSVPYRTIRSDWGLASLRRARDRAA